MTPGQQRFVAWCGIATLAVLAVIFSIGGDLDRYLQIGWTVATWWFLASVVCAPFFLLIRAARARGKRLFADEPRERVNQLEQYGGDEYHQDAL